MATADFTGQLAFIALIIGALLVLAIPGYAVVAAIYPRGGIPTSERIMLSLGLSLIGTALGALLLNLTAVGVGKVGWLVLLGGVTLAAVVVASVRRGEARVVNFPPVTIEPLPVLLLAGAILIVVGAGAVARAAADIDSSGSIIELWMLPNPSSPELLEVGLRSRDGGSYRLEIWCGPEQCGEWSSLSLTPGEPWRHTMLTAPGALPVEARLYRPDIPGRPLRVVKVATSPVESSR